MSKQVSYPYIPNADPDIKQQMLAEIGVRDVMDLYEEIPARLRYSGVMDIPEPIPDECSLKRHITQLLAKNVNADDYLSFLGAGCYQHYVPAVCDEVNGRGEFLTAYGGDPYADHGRIQALFEYASMMAELLDVDVVSAPLYDGLNAFAKAICMTARINGRREVLIAGNVNPDAVRVTRNYLQGVDQPVLSIRTVNIDHTTGMLDLMDLENKLSPDTAAVCIQNPSYLGTLESQANEIGQMAREAGAEFVVYVNPISLGVIAPPAHYGATITCGDIQPLGMHMQFGGGHGGFIASSGAPLYQEQYADPMFSLTGTVEAGEYGFGVAQYDKTSYGARENANEFTGTGTVLWAITAGVYLALMGPHGMEEIGKTILYKAHYTARKLADIKGIKLRFTGPFFNEFVLDFSSSGKTVAEVNRALLDHKIFGGIDLSKAFPIYGESALYCVTEMMTKDDIGRLVCALGDILTASATHKLEV